MATRYSPLPFDIGAPATAYAGLAIPKRRESVLRDRIADPFSPERQMVPDRFHQRTLDLDSKIARSYIARTLLALATIEC
jgi:hypothetical protein